MLVFHIFNITFSGPSIPPHPGALPFLPKGGIPSWLRTPVLEIQTIQPKTYLKYTNEFRYAGHMLPILISYKVILHTLTFKGIILSMITPIQITYSHTYPSVETDDMHRCWQQRCIQAVTILLGEAITLLIKLQANSRNTTLIWSVAFIANARLEES